MVVDHLFVVMHLWVLLLFSENFIGKIQNLSGCTQLRTLNLKGNKLRDLEDVIHLVDCPSVKCVGASVGTCHGSCGLRSTPGLTPCKPQPGHGRVHRNTQCIHQLFTEPSKESS